MSLQGEGGGGTPDSPSVKKKKRTYCTEYQEAGSKTGENSLRKEAANGGEGIASNECCGKKKIARWRV